MEELVTPQAFLKHTSLPKVPVLGRSIFQHRQARWIKWAIFSAALGTGGYLSAATLIWSAGTNGNWDVAANWTDSAMPGSHFVPSSTDTARINTTSLQTVTVDSDVGSITQLQLGNSINNTTGALLITTGGTLTAPTITTTDQAGGTSRITQNGGTLISTNVNWGRVNSTTSDVSYYMQGGALSVGGTIAIGGNGTGASAGGSGNFYQSGGAVTTQGLIINKGTGTGNIALYELSGGTLSVSGSMVNGIASSSANTTLRVIGSAGTITLQGNYSQNSAANLNVQLDNGGVTKINLVSASGTATLAGTLSAGFKGGVALTSGTSFRLFEAETLTGDFSTKPNTALWTTGTQANVNGTKDAYVLSLSSAAKVGNIANTDGLSELAFSGTSLGYAAITNLITDTPIQLYLNASAGSSNIAAMVAYFDANGLDATAVSFDGYNIELNFVPQATDSYFAWDLSPFNASAAISGIAVVPEPAPALLVTGALMSFAVLYRHRSRRNT